jgi:hypothetical protein
MMSESIIKRQPLIDLEEFERRMRQVDFRSAGGGDAVAELIRIVGVEGQTDEANAVDPSAASDNIASEPIAKRQTLLIDGDFAEIEAALLRAAAEAASPSEALAAPEPQTSKPRELDALVEEADSQIDLAGGNFSAGVPMLSAGRDEPVLPDASLDSSLKAPLALDRFVYLDDAAVSGSEAVAEEEKRSRRPLYIMAAVVLAGIAGIAVSTSLKRDSGAEVSQESSKAAAVAPAPSETASAKADPDATASAAALQQTSASADAAGTVPQGDAAPQHDAARVISLNQDPAPDNASPPLAAADAPASILAPAPLGAPGEAGAQAPAARSLPPLSSDPRKVKTAAVRPDGSLITADAPAATASPEAPPQEALANETPMTPAPAKSALADAATGKPALEKTVKPSHQTGAAKAPVKTAALPPHRPVSVAKSAESKPPHAGAAKAAPKTKPANAEDGQAAQAAAADPQPIAPIPAPEPEPKRSNGPLAFVDNAVNSISGATSKLLDWGRAPTADHN